MQPNQTQQTNNLLAWIVIILIIIGLIIWHGYSSSQNNQKIAQERQNCIQQVSQPGSAYSNPSMYCSELSPSDLNQDYPLTGN